MSASAVITIDRVLAATPARVFAAWTSPDDLEEWLADRATVDPRVGGAFRLVTDGGEELPGIHVCSGTYQTLDAPTRIVKSWKYTGPDPEETVETVITVSLAQNGGGTLMRFQEQGEGLESDEERSFSIDAWNGAFEALAALVDGAG